MGIQSLESLGLGVSGESLEDVQLGSAFAVRVRMPQRGWGRHAKHNKWCLPSTEQDMWVDRGQSPWVVDCKLQVSPTCAQLSAQSRWSKGATKRSAVQIANVSWGHVLSILPGSPISFNFPSNLREGRYATSIDEEAEAGLGVTES